MKRKRKSQNKKQKTLKELSNVEQTDGKKQDKANGAKLGANSPTSSILMGSSHAIVKPSNSK